MIIIHTVIKNLIFNLRTFVLQTVFTERITFVNQGIGVFKVFGNVHFTNSVLKSHNQISNTMFNLQVQRTVHSPHEGYYLSVCAS
jgi:hypothetical protein